MMFYNKSFTFMNIQPLCPKVKSEKLSRITMTSEDFEYKFSDGGKGIGGAGNLLYSFFIINLPSLIFGVFYIKKPREARRVPLL